MALDEFDRIATYFAPLSQRHAGAFGLRDDAAVLDLRAGQQLVVTTDALAENVHYLPQDSPREVACKALRCNLSDLAAMGAKPIGFSFTMALSSERGQAENDLRISHFSDALMNDIEKWDCPLIGGDSVSCFGPEMLSITAFGELPAGTALRRNGAHLGDHIFVSGSIGDAALGLRLLRDGLADKPWSDLSPGVVSQLSDRYRLPQPRVALGIALRGIATACMDVSDGLLQDLRHICAASGVGAEVQMALMPVSPAACTAVGQGLMRELELYSGGDDYELLFTAPPSALTAVMAAADHSDTRVTEIGVVTGATDVRLLDRNHEAVEITSWGYQHA